MPDEGQNPDYDPQRNAEEAMRADGTAQDSTRPKFDPYDNIRAYQWKKGQSGNPNGRPPGIRTLQKRMRQAGSLKASEIEPFKKVAKKLGLPAEVIDRMDVFDVFIMTTLLHGVRGRTGAMEQVVKLFGTDITFGGIHAMTLRKIQNKEISQFEADRLNAIEFYTAVLESNEVSLADKMKARERLDRIQGLDKIDTPLGAEEAASAIRDALGGMQGSIPDPKKPPIIDVDHENIEALKPADED